MNCYSCSFNKFNSIKQAIKVRPKCNNACTCNDSICGIGNSDSGSSKGNRYFDLFILLAYAECAKLRYVWYGQTLLFWHSQHLRHHREYAKTRRGTRVWNRKKKKFFDTSMKVVSMDSYGPKLISDTLFFCIRWCNKKCTQKNCQNWSKLVVYAQ